MKQNDTTLDTGGDNVAFIYVYSVLNAYGKEKNHNTFLKVKSGVSKLRGRPEKWNECCYMLHKVSSFMSSFA